MKNLIFAAALALGSTVPAHADVQFVGALVTTSATNCAFSRAGDTRTSRYRPSGQAGNPIGGGLTMMYDGGGYAVQFPGPLAALNVFQTVNTVEVGAFGIDAYNTRIKFTARNPRTVVAGTRSVFLRGVIEEPFNEKGAPGLCVVGFEASLVRAN